jgi:hypothetical protein
MRFVFDAGFGSTINLSCEIDFYLRRKKSASTVLYDQQSTFNTMSSPSGNQVPEDAAKTLSQMNAAEGKKAPDASGKIRKPRFKR